MPTIRAPFPKCSTHLDADGRECPNIADFHLVSDNGTEYPICGSCGRSAERAFGPHTIRLRRIR